MDESLSTLMQRFPEHRQEIEARYDREPKFRELCADYALLDRLVRQLKNAPAESAMRMQADYQEALLELEREVWLLLEPPASAAE